MQQRLRVWAATGLPVRVEADVARALADMFDVSEAESKNARNLYDDIHRAVRRNRFWAILSWVGLALIWAGNIARWLS
jgi:hypothetical protein